MQTKYINIDSRNRNKQLMNIYEQQVILNNNSMHVLNNMLYVSVFEEKVFFKKLKIGSKIAIIGANNQKQKVFHSKQNPFLQVHNNEYYKINFDLGLSATASGLFVEISGFLISHVNTVHLVEFIDGNVSHFFIKSENVGINIEQLQSHYVTIKKLFIQNVPLNLLNAYTPVSN